MTSSAEFEFECECTVKTSFEFRVPEMFRPVFHDVKCRGCYAVWTMRFRKTPEGLTATHKLKTGSVKLGEYLEKKKLDELNNRPKKKPFQLFQS